MLIRQLEYVVAVAREGHFGRAAASCWVSQPTLSDGINRLEAELGTMVIRRGRRYEGLTPEGDRLVTWARRLLAERDVLLAELGAGRRTLSGQLRIAAVPTALPPVPLVSADLGREHPEITISLTSCPADEIARRLSIFEIDAGFTYLEPHVGNTDLMCLPLYEERYLLVTPTGATADRAGELTWSEVAELPLCLLSPQMQNRRIIDARFRDEGLTVVPRVETDSLSVLGALISTGRWSSIVPQSWLHMFGAPPGTRVVRLAGPPAQATIGLAVLARDPAPMLVQALIAATRRLDLQAELDRVPDPALV
jgi:DNA-binding transcriptional LysR family regulator